MPFTIWPETLQDWKRVAVVKPDCPAEVIRAASGVERAKLTTTSREDILVFVSGFESGTGLHRIPDVVDDFVHDVEFKSKDDDLRMLVGVKEPCGKGPLWPCLTFTPEDVGYIPPMSLDLGKELLVSRMRIVRVAAVADHAVQISMELRPRDKSADIRVNPWRNFETLKL